MDEAASDNQEVARALQVVAQNLFVPVLGDVRTQPKWVCDPKLSELAVLIFFGLSKHKRPHDPEDTENEASDSMPKNYCSFGRIASRQSCPFITVDSVVNFGIKHEAADDDSDVEPKTHTTQ